MLKSILFSLAKKYIISSLNELLQKNKSNVTLICSQIQVWTARLTSLILLLNQVSEKCADSKLEDSEVDECIAKIETIVKEW